MLKYTFATLLAITAVIAYGATVRSFIGPTQVRSSAGSMTSSAIFEVNSTTKGFLPPKLTSAQIASVASPVAGLSVFNTTTNRWNTYDGSSWLEGSVTLTGDPLRNYILNSDHHTWQRSTSSITIPMVGTSTNPNPNYRSDRWYVKNALGTNGVITYSRVTSSLPDGAAAAAQAQITTAPTGSEANGCEAYYVLDNRDTIPLYNSTASLSVKVKSLNNVTSVGLQFMYKTSEAKVDTTIGSEQTCTVSTGSWTTCTISGQALGTSMTTSGVVGIRIRIAGVSSGNTYDINNGFLWTQAMMTNTNAAQTWQRAYPTLAQEISALQSTYEKSYNLSTAPGTVTTAGQKTYIYARAGSGQAVQASVRFSSRKVRTPTIKFYSPGSGAADVCGGAGSATATSTAVGESEFSISASGPGDQDQVACHWTADADL